MRFLIVPIAFAAALVAAAPASAQQRLSLADRVAILEQRSADNRVGMDLLNQVSELREEVRALRAQVEELQQQNEQLRASNRTQYLDLDGRLNRLEGNLPAAPVEGAAPVPQASAAPAAPAPADSAPRVHGDPGLLANTAGERAAYEKAFDALKSGDYVASADLFLAFLQAYPEGVYAPNARYWLGESYYVTQNYELARDQFQALVERYPTHDKTPGALLKVGLSLYGLRDLERAEATLAEVVERFPGTDAARTAEDRLHAIRLARVAR
jgi:tol-pal system protein YbgF